MSAAEQFHVSEVSQTYWRVTSDNGPVNLLDPDTVEQLAARIGRIENDPDLTVVVFRSEQAGACRERGHIRGHTLVRPNGTARSP
jgi:enoyl-CoA hydratase/carnithine racemase